MKKGKKGLALAMTLAVTMTSVPTAFALDGNAQEILKRITEV
jgi:hypothetical protein